MASPDPGLFPSGMENIDPELQAQTGEPELTVDELRAKLATEANARQAAEATAAAERDRMDRWIAGDRGRQEAAPHVDPPLGAMPDPATDPDKFAAWQAEKDRRAQTEIERRLETQRTELEQSVTHERRMAELWNSFQTAYPAHAKQIDLAAIAFQRVSQGGLPQDSAAVLDKVKEEMDRLAGQPITDGSPPANRTGGIQQGDRTSPKRPAPDAETKSPKTSFVDSIFERQKELGLI